MRKIQFKAWDKVNKRFITDYKRVLPTHYEGSKYPEQGGVNHNCVYVPICDETTEGLADIGGYIDDCDLLLWTGLKDKNGKEIYEGDIVTESVNIHKWIYEIGKVKGFGNNLYKVTRYRNFATNAMDGETIFSDFWLNEGERNELIGSEQLEIIGNIYENPELIK